MSTFKKGQGDWAQYISDDVAKVDFHFGRRDRYKHIYGDCMAEVHHLALQSLQKAQKNGDRWVMLMHGYSTSRPFMTTARTIVRGLMRSSESTPYIIKSQSIQFDAVFLTAIRPKRRTQEV
jgi:hypothetical protein